jgi:hypothetical protein
MKENQLIPLFKIIGIESERKELYYEFQEFFDTYSEFIDFINMQSRYYPRGILRKTLVENVTSYAINATMNKLRHKLGTENIEEYTLDDGATFYRIKGENFGGK